MFVVNYKKVSRRPEKDIVINWSDELAEPKMVENLNDFDTNKRYCLRTQGLVSHEFFFFFIFHLNLNWFGQI